ncbi:MAG: NAD-dependent epimerase/dehydratase family protein [Microthrixaceae bacterium]
MRALVTGGAGFIGSHLVDALVARGDTCTVLDDLSRGDAANLDHLRDAVTLVHGTVTDAATVADAIRGQDAVFHLASVVGVQSTIDDPTRVIDVAITGTLNVLRSAPPEAAVLVASSSEVFGQSEAVPFDEATPAALGSTAVRRWSYAHAKACVEHLAFDAGRTRQRPPAVVRYFNVYGPRMPRAVDPSVVSRFLAAAAADEPLRVFDGTQTRNFTYVSDAVDGTLAALSGAAGQVVNLGGPEETSVAELARLVVEVTGSDSVVDVVERPAEMGAPDEEPRRRSASGALARTLLGWRPTVPLRDGLERTWAAWSDQPVPSAPTG